MGPGHRDQVQLVRTFDVGHNETSRRVGRDAEVDTSSHHDFARRRVETGVDAGIVSRGVTQRHRHQCQGREFHARERRTLLQRGEQFHRLGDIDAHPHRRVGSTKGALGHRFCHRAKYTLDGNALFEGPAVPRGNVATYETRRRRRTRRGDAGARAGRRGAAQGQFDVVTRDQSVATRAGERGEVETVLLGVQTNRWRRTWREGRYGRRGGGTGRRRASGSALATVLARGDPLLVRDAVAHQHRFALFDARRRHRWRVTRRDRWGRAGRGADVKGNQWLVHFHDVADVAVQRQYDPGVGTGQLNGRLSSFNVHEGLVQRDDVADAHFPRDNFGLDETLAHVGQEKYLFTQLSNPITRSTASRTRSTLGR